MSEEIVTEEVVEEEVLPSEESKEPTIDEFLETTKSENGKIYGQFDSVQQALEHYRKQEVTHTNNMRELKNEQKTKQEEVQSVLGDKKQLESKTNAINELAPQFMQNGMKLTDEMTDRLKSEGISPEEIELGAFKLERIINKAHSIVGGKEEYTAMMEYANTNLDDATKADFDKSLKALGTDSNVGELAIEGLYNRYKQGTTGDTTTTDRVSGTSPNIPSNGGYTDFNELIADRTASKHSPSLKAKYLQKLANTDDKVLSRF